MQKSQSIKQTSKEDQFTLDIGSILNGHDDRTTIMIKNIPNKYTQ